MGKTPYFAYHEEQADLQQDVDEEEVIGCGVGSNAGDGGEEGFEEL